MSEFPKVSGASSELKEKVTKKFGASLAGKEFRDLAAKNAKNAK
jgi:hypothetical protein